MSGPAAPIAERVLLVAHGSSDPQAAVTTRALARAVAAARPGLIVQPAYLDHAGPRPDEALAALAPGGEPVVVVPLLLTAAYHRRVDLPAVLAAAQRTGMAPPLRVTSVLGPVDAVVSPWLRRGLLRRLRAAGQPLHRYDAVVLAAAGTRDRAAMATVEQAAGDLAAALGVPCRPGYASSAGPTPGEAVESVRAAGADQVAVAAYFLATGRLYRQAAAGARAAGAVAVADPLAAAPELVQLILSRVDDGASGGLSPAGGELVGLPAR